MGQSQVWQENPGDQYAWYHKLSGPADRLQQAGHEAYEKQRNSFSRNKQSQKKRTTETRKITKIRYLVGDYSYNILI